MRRRSYQAKRRVTARPSAGRRCVTTGVRRSHSEMTRRVRARAFGCTSTVSGLNVFDPRRAGKRRTVASTSHNCPACHLCAEQADHAWLRGWICGLQSLIPYWAGGWWWGDSAVARRAPLILVRWSLGIGEARVLVSTPGVRRGRGDRPGHTQPVRPGNVMSADSRAPAKAALRGACFTRAQVRARTCSGNAEPSWHALHGKGTKPVLTPSFIRIHAAAEPSTMRANLFYTPRVPAQSCSR